MDIRVPVGLPDLLIVDLRQPVICRDRAGVAQDKASYRISDGGILLHPPVGDLHIAVHDLFVIQHGGLQIPDLLPLLPVKDVSLRHIGIARFDQNRLHAVLDIFHLDQGILDLGLKVCCHLQGQQVDDVLIVLLLLGVKCFFNGQADLRQIEINDLAVSFRYLIHGFAPLPGFSLVLFYNFIARFVCFSIIPPIVFYSQ